MLHFQGQTRKTSLERLVRLLWKLSHVGEIYFSTQVWKGGVHGLHTQRTDRSFSALGKK